MNWDKEIAQLSSDDWRDLARQAQTATDKAYNKYSRFKVGAALRIQSDHDEIFTAANVENGSYGLTSCAERNAIFRAVAEKGRGIRWTAIALVAIPSSKPKTPPTFSPCGACRQVLYEFKASDKAKILFIEKGQFVTMTIAELLPVPFRFEPHASGSKPST